MSDVDLGFSQECLPWQVESYHFPSKIGGKPAWLALKKLPSTKSLECDSCHQPLIFLCQTYAPYEDDEANFHRTVFVFICREPRCCVRNTSHNIKAFRCSLPRVNRFYSPEPPGDRQDPSFRVEKFSKLCNVCGCLAEQRCSKCKKALYCTKVHQRVDWKEGHRSECGQEETHQRTSSLLFSQFEIVIETEEISQQSVVENQEWKRFNELKREGKIGTMSDVAANDMESYAAADNDRVFTRFKERIADNAGQVLRYERGGEPLWIAAEPKPDSIPNCEYCGGERRFEFQIMPQILSVLHENDLDIGIIVVYTCKRSCVEGDSYKREFVFKQDVTMTNL